MNSLTPSQLDLLQRALGPTRVLEEHVLAPYTTFKIGGPADAFYEATSADELSTAIQAARKADIPCFVLGLGANILVGDKGFRGLVIRNAARNMSMSPDGVLHVESGAIVWPDVIRYAIQCQFAGLEHYAGIPSTVGGALWQNLHFLSPAPKRERTMFIDEVFLDALLLTPENTLQQVNHEYFGFGYDQSILHHSGDIVLSARFNLEKGDQQNMNRIVDENLAWRKERHPPLETEPSAGSIFQKIEGIGAGRLIDECGMKGAREGGIEITQRHANIMINRGGGTASDVIKLIERVVTTVKDQKGHILKPEIAMIGEF
ncbi:MAG: UDP-N-acetylmuramate dehydrogenase [Bacteroidetes Order II. Incertae sedis bacterium]|nr:UDP-N-acetylmuramate dehydrogenase [Bacteroidetes Order II. bacterium]MBT4052790.1 UDP-N-acetylmuramate dehydrogenase [Bacteroidetes Order II. bacterium]MBT4603438.1 UDP-N-acetylmuramate dehydrogenase [Bacteroidetes Order II. bacterium]MBT5248635.1 UDP-N-acetylmuramate dehydrogenase [Bacteroidetes Order II. bacterium]MBT6200480.1 UDP-N-acetylmuramate dehydrogenase [Bacteroidetes Order II. bacterium]